MVQPSPKSQIWLLLANPAGRVRAWYVVGFMFWETAPSISAGRLQPSAPTFHSEILLRQSISHEALQPHTRSPITLIVALECRSRSSLRRRSQLLPLPLIGRRASIDKAVRRTQNPCSMGARALCKADPNFASNCSSSNTCIQTSFRQLCKRSTA